VIVTTLVAVAGGHPDIEKGIVYVTVYVPAVLVLGVIAPVLASMLNPVVFAVYVPPAVTGSDGCCAKIIDEQYGEPEYVSVCVGGAVLIVMIDGVCGTPSAVQLTVNVPGLVQVTVGPDKALVLIFTPAPENVQL
jgi:hypothetical protein